MRPPPYEGIELLEVVRYRWGREWEYNVRRVRALRVSRIFPDEIYWVIVEGPLTLADHDAACRRTGGKW